MICYTIIMILELLKITACNIQSLSAAIQRSEANRLQLAIKSMKAENRDKWTQVKKAFAISKEVNLKAMELLKQEALEKDEALKGVTSQLDEKDEALKGVTSQLDEYKDAATSALMIIRMAQRVSAAPEDSDPSDSIDDLATTLTTAAMALLEQLGELEMRYSLEFEEAWRLRESTHSNSNSNSNSTGLESAVLDRNSGKYLPSASQLLYTLHFTSYRTTFLDGQPSFIYCILSAQQLRLMNATLGARRRLCCAQASKVAHLSIFTLLCVMSCHVMSCHVMSCEM